MATGGDYKGIPGLRAAGDLSAKQFYIVKAASTAGQVKVASAATDALLGVLQDGNTDGLAVDVAFSGVAKVLAEASVSYGNYVTASSTGRAKATTTAGNSVIGLALNEATSAAGDIIPVLLSGFFKY